MTNEEAKHIVDVAFDVPHAVRRIGEDRTYQEDEIREAKEMAIEALQERLTGYWRQVGYDVYECTICAQNVMTGDICAYTHCHGCGAKMKVVSE